MGKKSSNLIEFDDIHQAGEGLFPAQTRFQLTTPSSWFKQEKEQQAEKDIPTHTQNKTLNTTGALGYTDAPNPTLGPNPTPIKSKEVRMSEFKGKRDPQMLVMESSANLPKDGTLEDGVTPIELNRSQSTVSWNTDGFTPVDVSQIAFNPENATQIGNRLAKAAKVRADRIPGKGQCATHTKKCLEETVGLAYQYGNAADMEATFNDLAKKGTRFGPNGEYRLKEVDPTQLAPGHVVFWEEGKFGHMAILGEKGNDLSDTENRYIIDGRNGSTTMGLSSYEVFRVG